MTEIQERSSKKTAARKPANRPTGSWTDENFKKAVELAGDGKTAREISTALGGGITRSAVICKLRRHEIAFAVAPSGGRGIARRGITKGSGKNAQGRITQPRDDARASAGGTSPDYEGAEMTAMAVTVDLNASVSGLGLAQSRVVVVSLDRTDWEDDRIEMARQLIEVKKLSYAQAAQQMGVQTAEMTQVCRQNKIFAQRTPRIRVLRPAETETGLRISRETPNAFEGGADLAKLDQAFTASKLEADTAIHYEPIPFLEATKTTCRYIVGQGDDGLAAYCGCPAVTGESWCRSHRSIVFTHKRG